MKTWTLAGAGDAADELAEVGPVLEGGEDAPELVALGELRGLHDVEQAVAEDLLDGVRVVLAQDLDDPVADPLRERSDAVVLGRARRGASRPARAVMSTRRSLRSAATALSVGWSMASSPSRVTSACLMAPSRRTRIRLAIRSLMATRSIRRMCGVTRLGRCGDARRTGDRRERRGGQAKPVLAGELDLAELVADHQLLDGGQRHGFDDRLDVEAVALIGRDAAGRRVRVGQQAVRLELGEDAAHGRAGHAEAVAVDERLAADRRRGRDVFLDDGPKDRLGAKVQGAEWAAIPSRQGPVSSVVSTLRWRVLTVLTAS